MNTLLYIAGVGRSGSTLLARVLRTAGEDVLWPGELIDLWQEGFVENRKCECGLEFESCEFWNDVVTRAGIDAPIAAEMLAAQTDLVRTRHLPRLMMAGGRPSSFTERPGFLRGLASLYASLFDVKDTQIVVDASKSPAYASILKTLPELDVHVVHIVRDPRGVAWSWNKQRINPSSGRAFGRMSFSKSALLWTTWNLATTALHGGRGSRNRYLLVRYEDFVADPASSVQRIFRAVGVSARRLPADIGDGVQALTIDRHHSIGGNPAKFSEGQTRFVTDAAWRRDMPAWASSVVTGLTWPLLIRYGYPLHPRSAR